MRIPWGALESLRFPPRPIREEDTFVNDPTFHHLTHTNDVPLPSEAAIVTSMLVALQYNMEDVDGSIAGLVSVRAALDSQLNEQLRVLEEEKARILEAISNRQSVVSASRRLPPEILSHIFLETFEFPASSHHTPSADSDVWTTFDSDEDAASILWTLERVCKRWREILIADCTLWSFVDIVVSPSNFAERPHEYRSHIEDQLNRAKQSPLSVCIRLSHMFTETNLPGDIPLILMEYADRIQELFLFIPHGFIEGLSALKPHLRSLRFLDLTNSPFEEWDNTITVFEKCDNLRYLEVSNIPSPVNTIALPWHNLTEYSSDIACATGHSGALESLWEGPRPHDFLNFFSMARNLRQCYLELEQPSEYMGDVAPVRCEHLQTFIVACWFHSGDGHHPLPQLLNGLTLPSLTNLHIHDPDGISCRTIESASIFTSAVDMIERSRTPSITLFEFGSGNIHYNDLIRLLQITPSLQTLELVWVGSFDAPVELKDVFASLCVQSNTHLLAPQLTTLLLSGHVHFEGTELVEMVHSRWQTIPFQELSLSWDPPEVMTAEEVRRELAVVAQGLAPYDSVGLCYSGDLYDPDPLPTV